MNFSPPSYPKSKKSILIVDDEIGIRELLAEVLRSEGFLVVLAESASKASQLRAQQSFDLLLLDMWMPNQNGLEMLADWQSKQWHKLPIVVMSGHSNMEATLELNNYGVHHFLEKPIPRKALLDMVQQAMQQFSERQSDEPAWLPTLPSPLMSFWKKLQQAHTKKRLQFCHLPGVTWNALGEIEQEGDSLWPFFMELLHEHHWQQMHIANQPMQRTELDVLQQQPHFWYSVAEPPESKGGKSALGAIAQKNIPFMLNHVLHAPSFLLVLTPKNLHQMEDAWRPILGDGVWSNFFENSLVCPRLADCLPHLGGIANAYLAFWAHCHGLQPCVLSPELVKLLQNQPLPWRELMSLLRFWANQAEYLHAETGATASPMMIHAAAWQEYRHNLLQTQAKEQSQQMLFGWLDLPLRQAREQFERTYLQHHLQRFNGHITQLAQFIEMERTNLHRKLKQLNILPSKHKP